MSLYEVSKEIEFDAGHRVPNHKSKCRNPHGHRYCVQVTISGQVVTEEGASDEGMLADFGDLKTIMTEHIHDVLDHSFIVYEGDTTMRNLLTGNLIGEDPWKVVIFPYIPTAENMAKWCFEEIVDEIVAMGFTLEAIKVWETPTSTATYYEG